MSKKINKKITRRSMLKSTTALAGAALGSGLITGFPAIHASGTPTIRYLGTAVNMGSEPEKNYLRILVSKLNTFLKLLMKLLKQFLHNQTALILLILNILVCPSLYHQEVF